MFPTHTLNLALAMCTVLLYVLLVQSVSVLLSHTVLAELRQEELMTEEDFERMIGGEGYMSNRLVPIQCTKPSEVATRATDILDKCGYVVAARELRGW